MKKTLTLKIYEAKKQKNFSNKYFHKNVNQNEEEINAIDLLKTNDLIMICIG